MPVVTVRAGGRKRRPGQFDTLVHKAAAVVSGLLARSDRVLVVYEEGSATLYYEPDEPEEGLRRRRRPCAS